MAIARASRRAARLGWVAVLVVACGSPSVSTPPAVRDLPDAAATVVAPSPPAFPAEVRSLRLVRSATVKLEPSSASKNLGTVAENTLVGFRGAESGPGCKGRWIAIEPRGYVCEAFLRRSDLAPVGVELPRLARGELVPGAYGKLSAEGVRIVTVRGGRVIGDRVLEGSAMVRRYDELELGGQRYWRIAKDEYVAARAVRPFEPSTFRGIRLGDETGRELPIGFALAAARPSDPVRVYRSAELTTVTGAMLAPRSVVTPLEVVDRDGAHLAYRIGEGTWLAAADVRMAVPSPPPPSTQPGERWIDIDLDRQLLVAYEGTLPVYVTLVTSGSKKAPTPTGIYRVWLKFAETDMNGRMADEPAYSVATVPWTQYFAKDLALHTTYWHDRLGEARSHGCINLAPIDARFLYFWSAPDVPPGWTMAHGVIERPGSMVRIRDAAEPNPEFRGYAETVAGARQGSR